MPAPVKTTTWEPRNRPSSRGLHPARKPKEKK